MSADNKKLTFFQELKRRNVYRVGVAYAVLTWLILQVIDTITPIFSLPEFAPKLVLSILAVGFPAVILFAWAFELTPEGLKREKDVDRTQSITGNTGQRLDRITIGVLLIAVGMLLVDKFFLSDAPAPVQIATENSAQEEEVVVEDETPSIAVLPFVNMSDDKSSAYFSDGLADTVLHMLAQISEIRVAARTSSFQFRDQAMDIDKIGEQLNVSTVLEGSVQRAGDTIRVTAQLIDVENGFHLWSGNFDRDLNDVFAIQDEIANEVVAALKVSLLGEVAGTLDLDQTENIDAYTEYLLGLNALNQASTESYSRAVSHLQAAVEFDPNYARAWSTLGRTYLDMEDYGALGTTEAIAAARDVGSRALDLVPESSEALAVLGAAEHLDDNYAEADALLSRAVEKGPNDTAALKYYGEYLMDDARPQEAMAVFEKAVRLDPLSEAVVFELANVYLALGRYDDGIAILSRWRAINPDSANMWALESIVLKRRGDIAAAIEAMKNAHTADPDDPEPPAQIADLYLGVGMPDEAQRWLNRAVEIDPDHPMSQVAPLIMYYFTRENADENVQLARELLDNKIGERRGSRDIAIEVLYQHSLENDRLDSFLEVLDNLYPFLFDDPPHDFNRSMSGTYFVGLALFNNGEEERGTEFLRIYREEESRFEDAYVWTSIYGIGLQLMIGDRDAALQRFDKFSETMHSSEYNYLALKTDPLFASVQDEPVVQALLAEYERNAAEQREILRAADAN